MPNNVQALLAGTIRTFKTTADVNEVHTPNHIAERDPADPMLDLVGEQQLTPAAYSMLARMKNVEDYVAPLAGDIALIKSALTSPSPWRVNSAWTATNITTKTTTLVKSGSGIMGGISINKVGSTDTLLIYDGLSAAGVLLGSITVIATDTWRQFPVIFSTGLVIVSSGGTAGDYTVFWL
jgi:hypothetical protein